jgi:hypothetical protein
MAPTIINIAKKTPFKNIDIQFCSSTLDEKIPAKNAKTIKAINQNCEFDSNCSIIKFLTTSFD